MLHRLCIIWYYHPLHHKCKYIPPITNQRTNKHSQLYYHSRIQLKDTSKGQHSAQSRIAQVRWISSINQMDWYMGYGYFACKGFLAIMMLISLVTGTVWIYVLRTITKVGHEYTVGLLYWPDFSLPSQDNRMGYSHRNPCGFLCAFPLDNGRISSQALLLSKWCHKTGHQVISYL